MKCTKCEKEMIEDEITSGGTCEDCANSCELADPDAIKALFD